MSLDPARRSARVTREIAERLARLARSLEQVHSPEDVAHFLMRCLFTMFAEDVGLLPNRGFTQLLADSKLNPTSFPLLTAELWRTMAQGGFSVALRAAVPHFDGGLFEETTALPLSADQIQLLIEAAGADWRDVEPAIFGALLVRALDPAERHKLGAHFTPRAYVERLVLPTIIEPLRAEWESVQTAALLLADQGKRAEALAEVRAFRRRLASIRILDPACGTANFLYVTLEHLKRLEGEVLEVLRKLGQEQESLELEGEIVRPEQFYGIEVNPRAAAIAELVLWIGYLQWHLRTRGNAAGLPEPILRNLHNIECRDAVLVWDAVEPLLDAEGRPVTRWDGRTFKPHPVTGEPMPDESARVPAWRYLNPRPAAWPEADRVVGNPPFIGTARMREALGDGYVEAVRRVYPQVPDSADYVMFWWDKAAELTRAGKVRRFGLITTNSLRQTFNRRVLEHHLSAAEPLSLLFAIPDHPWVDSAEGAAVRIAMTVGCAGMHPGLLLQVTSEESGENDAVKLTFEQRVGKIQADLTIGANLASASQLESNSKIAGMGVKLHGAGFIVSKEQAQSLGLGRREGLEKHIRPFRNGRDLLQLPRDVMVIDLFGLTEPEVRARFPEVYQWLYERVKPERDQNERESRRKNWWLFGEPISTFRPAFDGLTRYIATCRTAKHRVFMFLPSVILHESKVVAFALQDAYHLGLLSSRIHVVWALRTGAFLEDRPNYNHSECFNKFPFPEPTDAQKARIRALAEELDAHRKRQQALHPRLTLTDMYNVLEKLRAGEPLNAKDKVIHEQGLVSVLKQLHDDLDAAVFDAYGWSPGLDDEAILERLVDLNAERAAEEAQGLVRWLRPDYQAPAAAPPTQQVLLVETVAEEEAPALAVRAVLPWPDRMAEQAQAVRLALAALAAPAAPAQVAVAFQDAPVARVAELLETLALLGQATALPDGRFAGA